MRRLIYKNVGKRDPSGRIIEKNALYVRPYAAELPLCWFGHYDRVIGTARGLLVDWETGDVTVDVRFDRQFLEVMGARKERSFADQFDYSFYATDIIVDKLSGPWEEQRIVSARVRAIYVSPKLGLPARIAKELANGN